MACDKDVCVCERRCVREKGCDKDVCERGVTKMCVKEGV